MLDFSFCHTLSIKTTKNYIFYVIYLANKLPKITRYPNEQMSRQFFKPPLLRFS